MIVCNIIDPNILTYNTLDHRIVSNNAIESYIILGIILIIKPLYMLIKSYTWLLLNFIYDDIDFLHG